MFKRAKILVVALLLGGWAGTANAMLVDNGDSTFDTETGLTWLDLTETTGLSVQNIWDDVGGFLSQGWSVATSSQLDELFTHAGVPVPASELHIYADSTLTDLMLGLFGTTGFLAGDADAPYGIGLTDNGASRAAIPYYLSQPVDSQTAGTTSQCCVLYTDAAVDAGVWLVMPASVPTPATILLTLTALVGLGWSKRKQA